MRNYKQIIAWQLADELTIHSYSLTKKFPQDELFAMTSQLRRAAYSVPSNIAEGAGRKTDADFKRFLDISMGSLFEVEYFLHLARRLNYINDVEYNQINALCTDSIKCLRGFINSLNRPNN